MIEASEKIVRWPDIDEEAFVRFSQWAYTGEYTPPEPERRSTERFTSSKSSSGISSDSESEEHSERTQLELHKDHIIGTQSLTTWAQTRYRGVAGIIDTHGCVKCAKFLDADYEGLATGLLGRCGSCGLVEWTNRLCDDCREVLSDESAGEAAFRLQQDRCPSCCKSALQLFLKTI